MSWFFAYFVLLGLFIIILILGNICDKLENIANLIRKGGTLIEK